MLKRKRKKIWSQELLTQVMVLEHGEYWVPRACWPASLVYLESDRAIRHPTSKEIKNKFGKTRGMSFYCLPHIYTHNCTHTYISTNMYTHACTNIHI